MLFFNRIIPDRFFRLLGFCLATGFAANAAADAPLKVALTVPDLDADPYHRPYVAIWIETPERDGLKTLVLWHYQEDDTWLKDLRQWWRKLGRGNRESVDAISGATRRPDHYEITWDGRDKEGSLLPSGEYLLNFEVVREEGDRTYYRETIQLGKAGTIKLPANNELGEITITLTASGG